MEHSKNQNNVSDTCIINQRNLNSFIEIISDFAFILDLNYKYIHFNNTYSDWSKDFFDFEITAGKELNNQIEDKSEWVHTKEAIDKAFEGQTVQDKVCWTNIHSETIEFHLSATPLSDNNKKIYGALIIIKKNKKESSKTYNDVYKDIFNKSIVGKSLTTIDGRLRVNPGYCKILGYSENELNNTKWEEITHKEDIERNKNIIADILANKEKSHRWAKRYIHKKGHIIWVDISTTLLRDENENPLFFITEIIDITEQKRSEIALAESEAKFRKAIFNAPFPIMLHSEDGKVELINEEWTIVTGYSLDEIPTTALWAELAYGDRKNLVMQEINSVYALSEKEDEGEYLINTKSGETRNWHFSSTSLGKTDEGKKLAMSMAIDITETKRAQEITIKNKERLNRAEFASKSGNWELHLETGTIYASRGARKLYGLGGPIWSYKEIKEIPLLEYRHLLDEALKNIIEKNKPYDIEFKIKTLTTGEIKDIHSTATYDSENKIVFGVIKDITEKKSIEKEIKDNEAKFVAMFDSSPIAFTIYEMDGRISKANLAFCELTGYSEKEMTGKTTLDLNLLEFEKREKMLEQINKQGGTLENFELELLRKDGTKRNILISSKNITINSKQFRFGINIDITNLKHTENKLRESEQILSNLFSSMSEMVVFHEMIANENGEFVDYRLLDCNNSFTHITGIKKSDAVGKLATEVYKTEEAPYLKEYSNVCKSGRMQEYKTYFAPMDKHFIISAIPLSENQFSTVTTDITDIQSTHEAIIANNKELENYIYVASHDLRSPLVNIQGFSQRLKKHADSLIQLLSASNVDIENKNEILEIANNKVPKDLNYIQTNVVKMDKLINGLLQISRTGRLNLKFQNINMRNLINAIISNHNFQLSEIKATIKLNNLPNCYGDENLLNQLFSNIILNAIKYRDLERQFELEISSQERFTKIIYSIKDNGIGISARHIEKIWDVFYRVDASSSIAGEGLGLSFAKRIVDKHKGKIWAESEEGKGTIFFIELHKNEFSEV